MEKAVHALKRGREALRIKGPSSNCCTCNVRFMRGRDTKRGEEVECLGKHLHADAGAVAVGKVLSRYDGGATDSEARG